MYYRTRAHSGLYTCEVTKTPDKYILPCKVKDHTAATNEMDAIQELRDEIQALRNEIQALRKENAELRKENAELRNQNAELQSQVKDLRDLLSYLVARNPQLIEQINGVRRPLYSSCRTQELFSLNTII